MAEDDAGGGKKGGGGGDDAKGGYDWASAGKELSLQTRRAAETPAGLEMIKVCWCGVGDGGGNVRW